MHYHLLIDADDTLWENNIYFERAIHAFIEFLIPGIWSMRRSLQWARGDS